MQMLRNAKCENLDRRKLEFLTEKLLSTFFTGELFSHMLNYFKGCANFQLEYIHFYNYSTYTIFYLYYLNELDSRDISIL